MKLNWLKCIKNCIGSKFIQINIKVDYQTRLHPRPVACADMTLPLMNGSGDNHCPMDHFDVNHCLMDHFDDNHCLMDHFDDSITLHNGPLWWFHCFYFHCSPLRSSLVHFGPLDSLVSLHLSFLRASALRMSSMSLSMCDKLVLLFKHRWNKLDKLKESNQFKNVGVQLFSTTESPLSLSNLP